MKGKISLHSILINSGLFAETHGGCSEFLRHKTYLVSPKVLAHNNIPVNKVVQYEGEFIITFPYGYHAGYNIDFNIAESVNFATSYWVDIGSKARVCNCLEDSVKIDMSIFGEGPPPEPKVITKASTNPLEVPRKRKGKAKKPQRQFHYIPTPPQKTSRTSRVSTLGLQPIGKVYFDKDPDVPVPAKKTPKVFYYIS